MLFSAWSRPWQPPASRRWRRWQSEDPRLDPLTGLPGGGLIDRHLPRFHFESLRHHLGTAILFFDGDDLKALNDAYGHHTGDLLIRHIARIIEEMRLEWYRLDHPHAGLKYISTAYRKGGDEFVVILGHLESSGQALEFGRQLVTAIHQRPFEIFPGTVHYISMSVGVAWSDRPLVNPAQLVHDADSAAYLSKELKHQRRPWERVVLCTPDLLAQRLELERSNQRWNTAITESAYIFAVQPIVDPLTRRIISGEILVRLPGQTSMEDVIDERERRGQTAEILFGLIEKVFTWTGRCRQQGLAVPGIFLFNAPALVITQDGLFDRLAHAIRHYVHPSGCVIGLEFTERTPLPNTPLVHQRLLQLQQMGVNLALDDFGTGHNNISTLRDFIQFTWVKIARQLLPTSPGDERGREILQGAITLAQVSANMLIVEGIETEDHAQILQEELLSAHRGRPDRRPRVLAQGYYYSKPVTPMEFEFLLARQATSPD